jgi:hypothetical protein
MVDLIVQNEKLLPDSIKKPLSDAFGKTISKEGRDRPAEAKARLDQIPKKDLVPTADFLNYISRIKHNPLDFLNLRIMGPSPPISTNVLYYLYYQSRQANQSNVALRAFYATATHLFIKQLCVTLNATRVTPVVLGYCAYLILEVDPDAGFNTICGHLQEVNKIGSIYYQYAQGLGGYGAFFIIGILPSWV